MRRLIVLGAGTCVAGRITRPDRVSLLTQSPPGFVLIEDNTTTLIECSSGSLERYLNTGLKLKDLNNILISHAHPDHFAGWPVWIQSLFAASFEAQERGVEPDIPADIKIIAPKQVITGIDKLFDVYQPERNGRLYEKPKLHITDSPNCLFGDIKIATYSLRHSGGKCENFGFRLSCLFFERSFAFSGDTGPCDNLYFLARNAELFICECSTPVGTELDYSDKPGHLSPYQAGEVAKKAGVKTLALYHYTGYNTEEEIINDCRRSGFAGELILLKDGMIIDF